MRANAPANSCTPSALAAQRSGDEARMDGADAAAVDPQGSVMVAAIVDRKRFTRGHRGRG